MNRVPREKICRFERNALREILLIFLVLSQKSLNLEPSLSIKGLQVIRRGGLHFLFANVCKKPSAGNVASKQFVFQFFETFVLKRRAGWGLDSENESALEILMILKKHYLNIFQCHL